MFWSFFSGIDLIDRTAQLVYIGGMDSQPIAATGPLSILLVEDNPVFAKAVQQYLGLIGGLRVVGHALNGPQAIALTLEHHPDLLLLDISLGGMTGFDVAHSFAAMKNAPKIVFLTMHDQLAYRAQAQALGALAYVLKDNFVQDFPCILEGLSGASTD